MKRRAFISTSAMAGLALTTVGVGCNKCLDAEVLILGGGYSGLYLANLLQKAGISYKVLEGSDRIGGRLFTNSKIGDREVGGRGIGDRYDLTIELVNELGVELIDITDYMRSPTAIYHKGKMINDWDTSISPNPRMLEYTLSTPVPQLDALNEWYQRPDLDRKYSEILKKGGRTESELDIINVAANYNDVRVTSAVNAIHSGAFRKFNESKRIFNFKDGSKTFVEAIQSQLAGEVLTNKMITSISADGKCMSVKCEDGSTYCGSKIVSTMPFSTLRDVEMNVSFSDNQTKAIKELGYTKITQIHLQPTKHFWEEDGLHVDMWTDTKLERIMNTSPLPDQYALVCWVNGTGTRFFDNMTDSEIEAYTLNELKRIRPSTEGNIEYVGTHKWGQYRYNKGAYAEFQVGQAGLFEDMIKPAGGMHFAGEHTAKESRGIEGAAESALRVFKELTEV